MATPVTLSPFGTSLDFYLVYVASVVPNWTSWRSQRQEKLATTANTSFSLPPSPSFSQLLYTDATLQDLFHFSVFRLCIPIGGVLLYCASTTTQVFNMVHPAKRPTPIHLDARTNKPVQIISKVKTLIH